jgi:hypothetical protein
MNKKLQKKDKSMNIKLKIKKQIIFRKKKGKHVMVASTPLAHLFYFSLDTNIFSLVILSIFQQ